MMLKSDVDKRLEQIKELYDDGFYQVAADKLRRLLEALPDNALVHAQHALWLIEHEDDFDPTSVKVWTAQASPWGNASDPLLEARIAVGLDPINAWCKYVLSRALLRIDDADGAEKAIKLAVELDPNNGLYFGQLSSVYRKIGEWELTLESADRGPALDPGEFQCLYCKLSYFAHTEQFADAARVSCEQLKLYPEDEMLVHTYALFLLYSDQNELAEQQLRYAVQLSPESEWSRSVLRRVLNDRNPFFKFLQNYPIYARRLPAFVVVVTFLLLFGGGEIVCEDRSRNTAYHVLGETMICLPILLSSILYLSHPIETLALLMNPTGRLIVSSKSKTGVRCFFGAILGLAIGIVLCFTTGQPAWMVVGSASLPTGFLVFFAIYPRSRIEKWLAIVVAIAVDAGIIWLALAYAILPK